MQTVNEVSRMKSTAKTKLKATSQDERVHLLKQHSEKIISNQLDIKLGQFKNIKQQGLMKYPQKYGRLGNSTTYRSDTVMPYIIKTLDR